MLFGVFTLIASALFTGAALYISLVEHPARLRLDDAALLAQWQPSYKAALPIQAGLAVVGGMLGLIAWYYTAKWQWMVGSLLLLANWPFTMFAIMPTNKRLLAMRPQDAGPESRKMLVQWGSLHNVRSALGTSAMLLFAYALVVS
jgi:hypothetical protein